MKIFENLLMTTDWIGSSVKRKYELREYEFFLFFIRKNLFWFNFYWIIFPFANLNSNTIKEFDLIQIDL